MKSRYEGIQNKLWGIREGCFFLCLCSIAEEYNRKKIDLIDTINLAFDKKLVRNDYFVNDDCKLLSLLTGKKVTRLTSNVCGNLKDNEYSIAKYLNKEGTANHFDRRYFKVYTNSKTVRDGVLLCYYIYTIGG